MPRHIGRPASTSHHSSEVTVTCRPIGRGAWTALAVIIAGMLNVSRAAAQAPAPTTSPPTTVPAPAPPALALYRAPVIALVQPAAGGSVPQDKPVVVFRFAQGEANDAIDARSLTVGTDGKDVTTAFQVATGEAWGPLALAASGEAALPAIGAHQLTARICSERGACASTTATLTVSESRPAPASKIGGRVGKGERLLDLFLRATRKLIVPD